MRTEIDLNESEMDKKRRHTKTDQCDTDMNPVLNVTFVLHGYCVSGVQKVITVYGFHCRLARTPKLTKAFLVLHQFVANGRPIEIRILDVYEKTRNGHQQPLTLR